MDIILLHGAMGSNIQMRDLKEMLAGEFSVHALNLPGHGGLSIPTEGFSIESFARYVLSYIEEKQLTDPVIFGYSMGGYVGMYLAAIKPGIIKGLITLGTKYLWDETIAAGEVKMLDADVILSKVPAFAEELQKRHQPQDWKEILEATALMLTRMGIHSPLQVAHFNSVQIPCLLLVGDRDTTVSIGETMAVYKQVPKCQFGVVPESAHAIEKTDIKTISYFILNFCDKIK